jgi:hypothetical protein
MFTVHFILLLINLMLQRSICSVIQTKLYD